MPATVNASFIFQGTVQQLKATTVQQVPVNDRTAIVRVDQVLQAPAELQHYGGQRITVQVGGNKPIKQGQRAVFYTSGWVFAESLAVQSVDHADAAAATAEGDPVGALKDRQLKEHVNEADLVITGRVVSIRVPADAPRALAEGSTGANQSFSEHDPGWLIATVAIDNVHRGAHAAKTVDVRFPGSTDVRWFAVPKFHPGQEGHFLLHKEAPAAGARREAPGSDPGDYVVLHSTDFQPIEQPGGVKDLAGGSTGATRR